MGPLTPVSDNDRAPMKKYSPWGFTEEHSDDKAPVARSQNSLLYKPPPKDIEILLKTYWSSIHPVSSLVAVECCGNRRS